MIIYAITNLINEKQYIGLTTRKNKDFDNYWGSGTLIQSAIKKYGIENFHKEILQYCFSKLELIECERYWITKLNSIAPHGYNIHSGGLQLINDESIIIVSENKDHKLIRKNKKRILQQNWEEILNLKVDNPYCRHLKLHTIKNELTGEFFDLIGQEGAINFVKQYNENKYIFEKLNWTNLLYKGSTRHFKLIKSERIFKK